MSRLTSKGAERHADFLAGTPNWVNPMSRPLCMSRPYESTSVAVQAKDTELSIFVLHHMSWPHESTPVYESTPWVDPYAWVDPMSRLLRWKNSVTASF